MEWGPIHHFFRVRAPKSLPKLLTMQTFRHYTSSRNYGQKFIGLCFFFVFLRSSTTAEKEKNGKNGDSKEAAPPAKKVIMLGIVFHLLQRCRQYQVHRNILHLCFLGKEKKISVSRTRQMTISHLITWKKKVVCNLVPRVSHLTTL